MSFRSIKFKLMGLIAVVVVFVCLVGYFSISYALASLVSHNLSALEKEMHERWVLQGKSLFRQYNSLLKAAEGKALDEAALFASDPKVLAAYAIANSGDLTNENDAKCKQARKILKDMNEELIGGMLKTRGREEYQLHFHTKNVRSLARTWRKGWQAKRDGKKVDVTDDLTSFRNTILKVAKERKPVSGIELGRGGFVIRGLCPIFNKDGEYLGSDEVLVPFKEAMIGLDESKDVDVGIYMDQKFLTIATKLRDSVKFPIVDGKYVRVMTTNNDLIGKVIKADFLFAAMRQSSNMKSGNQFISGMPIKDFQGQSIGALVVVQNISQGLQNIKVLRENAADKIVTMQFYTAVGMVLTLIVLVGGIGIYVNIGICKPINILTDRIGKLASEGDIDTTISQTLLQRTDELGELFNATLHIIEAQALELEAVTKMASRNWDIHIPVRSPKDKLSTRFNDMVDQVNQVLGQTIDATNVVADNACQVSNASQSLSEGATEQAASLEEITSSITELSSQTENNAINANKTKEIATSAHDAAKLGNGQMQQMVEAMSEINHSSQKISKIIKVIDDIAFQTNLLALNAAVEAARAGRHGKGFAIVAEEVRNLAVRSAKAANETAALIEDSGNKVKVGAKVAKETEESLSMIVDGIAKANDLIGEIAVSCNEQAQGISQINID